MAFTPFGIFSVLILHLLPDERSVAVDLLSSFPYVKTLDERKFSIIAEVADVSLEASRGDDHHIYPVSLFSSPISAVLVSKSIR